MIKQYSLTAHQISIIENALRFYLEEQMATGGVRDLLAEVENAKEIVIFQETQQ